MPLYGTPALNVTMKAGTTISADKLTAWQDIVNLHEYTPWTDGTTTAQAPATNVESLNGFPVAKFNGVDTALHFSGNGYQRRNEADGLTTGTLIKHIVMKIPSVGNDFYYEVIEQGSNGLHNNSTYLFEEGGVKGLKPRSGGTSISVAIPIPLDEWFVWTEVTIDDNAAEKFTAYVNGEKVFDAVAGVGLLSDTSSILGSRSGTSYFAEFSIAQMAHYTLPYTQSLTEQQIQDNILFLMSEWDLAPKPSGVITHNNQPVESAVVTYLQADPLNVSNVQVGTTWTKRIENATILGQSITNAQGEHEYTGASFDNTKLLGIAVHYKYWDGVKWVQRSKTEWKDLNLDLSDPTV